MPTKPNPPSPPNPPKSAKRPEPTKVPPAKGGGVAKPAKPAKAPAATKGKSPKPPQGGKLEGTEAVDAYMAALDHPRKAEIEAVRSIVLGASPRIAERVKWNVPSFHHRQGSGEDLAAFHLRPEGFIQLVFVFHRGKMIEERKGLLEGDYKDRRLAKFTDLADVAAKREALEWVVRRWEELVEEG